MTNPSASNLEQILDDDEHNESKSFILQSVAPATPSSATSDTTPPLPNMADEKKNKKKHVYKEAKNQEFLQHMTTAAHACVLLYVILIIYFCFSGDFQFFTWHPLLLSTGWMFLMTEAILTMSKENLFTGTLPKKVRVRLHWIFLIIALTFITIGFTIVYVNKNNLNKEHFKTWHAFFGLIGIISAIPTALNGIAALYHGDIRLRNYISPKLNKFIHFTSGVITFTFGGLALILSVYTKWFARNSNDNIITFVLGLALVVFPIVWTLIRPTTTCLGYLKDFLHLKDSK